MQLEKFTSNGVCNVLQHHVTLCFRTGDSDQTDMDTILVLTRDSYYLAQYEEASDRITRYQRVSLIDLDHIEVGPYTL